MDQRNLFLAIGITLVIIVGWTMLYEEPRARDQQTQMQAQTEAQQPGAPSVTPTAPGSAPGSTTPPGSGGATAQAAAPEAMREHALAETPRLRLKTSLGEFRRCSAAQAVSKKQHGNPVVQPPRPKVADDERQIETQPVTPKVHVPGLHIAFIVQRSESRVPLSTKCRGVRAERHRQDSQACEKE